jgi:hypothetical protein
MPPRRALEHRDGVLAFALREQSLGQDKACAAMSLVGFEHLRRDLLGVVQVAHAQRDIRARDGFIAATRFLRNGSSHHRRNLAQALLAANETQLRGADQVLASSSRAAGECGSREEQE